MRITNESAYNAPVVVSLSSASSQSRRAFSSSEKRLKPEKEEAEVLSVTEVAQLLRVSHATALRMCKAGAIPCRKILNRYYIHRDALLAHLKGIAENGNS